MLRDELIKRIEELPNLKVALWKNTDLLCVLNKDKEIAHFQSETELDIRLTPKIIKQKGLQIPENSSSHLDRSKNSRWIVQSFEQKESFEDVLQLIKIAAEL